LIGIVTPPGVPSDAIKLAVDFVHLLGARPFFTDLLEMDGLLAAAYILPQLMSAALVNATMDQPGWQEARKFAGRAYAKASAAIESAPTSSSLSWAAISSRDNVLRVLDNALAALRSLRDDLDRRDLSSLEERLSHARQAREEWLKERKTADWIDSGQAAVEPPSVADWFGSLIGIRRKTRS
jgi:prephenate dehydrogenase